MPREAPPPVVVSVSPDFPPAEFVAYHIMSNNSGEWRVVPAQRPRVAVTPRRVATRNPEDAEYYESLVTNGHQVRTED